MLTCGDGLAVGSDLAAATQQALDQALAPFRGEPPDLLCLFACAADPDAVAEAGVQAARRSKAGHVLGCSASGVIGAGHGVEATSAVSVWAARLPGALVRTFHLEVLRTPEGMAVVGMPERGEQDRVAILLADPYSFPVDGFIAKANHTLPGLPFVGGVAAGPAGAGSTRLLVDGRPVDRGAVGAVLAFGDDAPMWVRSVVSQGCRPVGPEMVITRAEGNVLLELAGQPALGRLEAVVAELSPDEQVLVGRGLQVGIAMDEYAEEHEQGDFLVRGVVGADEERGALVVGDLLEVGRTVRFHVRDAMAATDDLSAALARLRATAPAGEPKGALLFSCNGRGRSLFATADHDVRLVRRAIAPVGVGGFFAGGEIGPVAGRNYVHGHTASILAFGTQP